MTLIVDWMGRIVGQIVDPLLLFEIADDDRLTLHKWSRQHPGRPPKPLVLRSIHLGHSVRVWQLQRAYTMPRERDWHVPGVKRIYRETWRS